MGEADPSEGFTVRDRRRQSETSEPPAQGVPHPEPQRGPAPRGRAGRADADRSLMGLFMMLGSSAVIALGEAPDPVTGQRHRDLSQAEGLIDLLALLREKTEGHRTADETRALEELIYDLQLRYVSAAKGSG